MADHIYVQIDPNGESVVLGARNGAVIFKHQEDMEASKVRKIVAQLQSRLPDAEVHEVYYDGGFRSPEKRRNVREWEEGWKKIDAARDTHLQLTPDNEIIEEGDPVPNVYDVRAAPIVLDPEPAQSKNAD